MSIEEKAKAYDEALEKAKKYHEEYWQVDAKDITETLFPELRESEDERIRKFFAELATDACGGPGQEYYEELGLNYDKVMGWLEKQKGQKPILKFKVGDKIHLIDGTSPNYEDDCITIREIGTINYIGEFKEGYVPINEQDKWELAKEQKPVEPSDEELERHQKELYDFKVFAAKQAKEHHISFVHDFEWNNFCAELLSYFHEQKPAEYLTEEKVFAIMKKLTSLSFCVPLGSNEEKQIHEITSDVRSLLDYPIEQKPAWSEEDKKILDDVSHILIGLNYKQVAKDYKQAVEKLLYSRPSWKPSEEQMKGLKFFLDFHRPQRNAGTTNWKEFDAVESLYEQIRKL